MLYQTISVKFSIIFAVNPVLAVLQGVVLQGAGLQQKITYQTRLFLVWVSSSAKFTIRSNIKSFCYNWGCKKVEMSFVGGEMLNYAITSCIPHGWDFRHNLLKCREWVCRGGIEGWGSSKKLLEQIVCLMEVKLPGVAYTGSHHRKRTIIPDATTTFPPC